jgi:hypothetical protein
LACQDEFFANHPLDVKENDEHALDFALHLSRLFSVFPERNMPFKHTCTAHAFFPEHLSDNCDNLGSNLMLFLVGSIAKSHQARYTTPKKKDVENQQLYHIA